MATPTASEEPETPTVRPPAAVPGPQADVPGPPQAEAPAPVPSGAYEYANRPTWFPRLLALLRREPALALTLAYLVVVAVGLWSSYWYYRVFGIPVLEYMQIGDFLMSGLRDPIGLLFLVYLLACSLFALWPTRYWMRNPERVRALRQRRLGRWWFSDWVSPFRRKRWYEVGPETSIVLGLVLGGGVWIAMYAKQRAADVVADPDRQVRVTLVGEREPLRGEARLLGTTGGHVFLYWPANGRTEALPQTALARIERWPRRVPDALHRKARR